MASTIEFSLVKTYFELENIKNLVFYFPNIISQCTAKRNCDCAPIFFGSSSDSDSDAAASSSAPWCCVSWQLLFVVFLCKCAQVIRQLFGYCSAGSATERGERCRYMTRAAT